MVGAQSKIKTRKSKIPEAVWLLIFSFAPAVIGLLIMIAVWVLKSIQNSKI